MPIVVIGILIILGVILTQQKPPNIALLKWVFCTLFIVAPLIFAIGLLVGIRRYGKMWVIGQGWISAKSHPFTFRAVITAILLFLSIPMMIGILTAIGVIPFSIKIDGRTYSDPEPLTTPLEAQ